MTDVRGPYLLDPDAYPFQMEAVGHDGEVLWSMTVEKPEGLGMVRIPGFGDRVAYTRCTFSLGKEAETSVAYTHDGREVNE